MKLIRRIRSRLMSLRTKLVNEPAWITVYQSMEAYSIEIRKLALEDEGIKTLTFDQRDSSYNAFGYIYLQVHQKNVERANEILKLIYE